MNRFITMIIAHDSVYKHDEYMMIDIHQAPLNMANDDESQLNNCIYMRTTTNSWDGALRL